ARTPCLDREGRRTRRSRKRWASMASLLERSKDPRQPFGYAIDLPFRQRSSARQIERVVRNLVCARAIFRSCPPVANENFLKVRRNETLSSFDALIRKGVHQLFSLSGCLSRQRDVVHPVHITGIALFAWQLERVNMTQSFSVQMSDRPFSDDDLVDFC